MKAHRAVEWADILHDGSTDCTEVLLACLTWTMRGHGFMASPSHPPLQPDSPGSAVPCAPAPLFLESAFILILITNLSSYNLHPSALDHVWKHLRLTLHNSGLASSSHHETDSASFFFSHVPGKPSNPILLFDLNSRLTHFCLSTVFYVFCLFNSLFILFSCLFLPPPLSFPFSICI